MNLKSLEPWYRRNERHVASFALVIGFIFDILTLRRPDTLWENSWIVLYLVLSSICILLLTRKEHPWLLAVMQFSFGGLLSAFLILYFRSATLSASWPFLLILLAAFIANERLEGYRDRLIFQVSFLYLSFLTFAIYFLPVIVGEIGVLVFVASGIASLLLIRAFVRILMFSTREKYRTSRKAINTSILTIFVVMNVFYFFNIIPPIPLSLKDAGVYHSLAKDSSGNYFLTRERPTFLDYFRTSQRVGLLPGNPVYAYTAVFSPARFSTPIIHEWQRYDEELGDWVTMSRISLNTSGGRNAGYRTFSLRDVSAGKWRVNVITERGLMLGRINFSVRSVTLEPRLVVEIH